MIKIEIPTPDITITERKQIPKENEPEIKDIYGFIDFHLIPRDKGGIFMFYNINDELLFVGKARKLRQRIKKHFEDTVSPLKTHRDEVHKIEICIVEDPTEREIYETYIINELHSKYNVDKVFYK
ncbi:nucleotide excision repair endonuclease [Cytobacillus sp. S13-E01]|uniref:nucleotide excision repair endonuclease n=1 Tax=Cytobacillus sp. S13-E01 TaxID=3031326 RepID=UPI0023D7F396|nr:nucleotide excision repair endonuclease [Cytobacillus sp. S13-E01]MDF0725519.1 nucleotide excision repair endonuclease [Cytobacillus sp. S13-E01]